jgi:hypothetical protein
MTLLTSIVQGRPSSTVLGIHVRSLNDKEMHHFEVPSREVKGGLAEATTMCIHECTVTQQNPHHAFVSGFGSDTKADSNVNGALMEL